MNNSNLKMADHHKIKYITTIIQHEAMDAGFVEFPFEVKEFFGKKGKLKVKAVFDGKVLYRGSLFNMGCKCHVLGITKDIRKQLNKTFGDQVQVEIEEDLEVREVIVPVDVSVLLDKNPKAREYYEGLSFTDRKEYMSWIETAKKQDTREKRVLLFIEKTGNGKKLHDK